MSTEAVADYIAAAAPFGHIDYYVLLFTSPEVRPVAAAALATGKVITRIPRQDTDVAIRQLKLHWWLEEAELFARNQPRHPLTRALREAGAGTAFLDPLRQLVAGCLGDIDQASLCSLPGVLKFCHYQAAQQRVIAASLPECSDQDLQNAEAAGVGIALTRLLTYRDSRTVADFLAEQRGELHNLALDHFASMQAPSPAQIVVWLQARLYQQRLEQAAAPGAGPGPLKLLWRAWREARKLHR